MGRAPNKFVYKYHVTGSIADVEVDKKYCSYSGFLEEYGGESTPLLLNKTKLTRLINHPITKGSTNKRTQQMAKLWNLTFAPIREPRAYKVEKVLID